MKAVNLTPPSERGRTSVPTGRSGGGAYVVLGLLGGLALLTLLYGSAAHQISNDRGRYASIIARTARTQARAAELTPYTSFVALREQRVQAVSELMSSRFDWANSFYELGRVLPASASISSLEGQIGAVSGSGSGSSSRATSTTSTTSTTSSASGSSVTSATPPGSIPTFTLVGCATSQSDVATMLERLRLITGVAEVQLQSAAKSSAGAASSSCEGNNVSFTVHVTFDALPSVSSGAGSAGTPVSSSAGAGSASGASSAPASAATVSTQGTAR